MDRSRSTRARDHLERSRKSWAAPRSISPWRPASWFRSRFRRRSDTTPSTRSPGRSKAGQSTPAWCMSWTCPHTGGARARSTGATSTSAGPTGSTTDGPRTCLASSRAGLSSVRCGPTGRPTRSSSCTAHGCWPPTRCSRTSRSNPARRKTCSAAPAGTSATRRSLPRWAAATPRSFAVSGGSRAW